MISIIVPVYNTEQYLVNCLDSIVHQTFKNLEIILIDDGSTDQSGVICEHYKKIDKRIKVYHTENRGLSAARNLGLDKSCGEYIGFVDSDDWLELDMYECLMRTAKRTGADIIECGIYVEYYDKTVERKRDELDVNGKDAILMLLRGNLSNSVWNKLWKRSLFTLIRFPEGRIYEDIATTYKVFLTSQRVQSVNESKYHYFMRKGSLSKTHNMKNLIDFWISHIERFNALYNGVDEESKSLLLRNCAEAVARTWSNYHTCTIDERKSNRMMLEKMSSFSSKFLPLIGCRGWGLRLRVGVIFPHYNSSLSLGIAHKIDYLYKRLKEKKEILNS